MFSSFKVRFTPAKNDHAEADAPHAASDLGESATWIVSYPRSGNTFLRTLLSNYLSGLDRAMTLQEIHLASHGEHIGPFWQQLTGKPPVERTFAEEFAQRADYFRILRDYLKGQRKLFKSHTPFIELDGVPAFRFASGDRIVHVVRHPCDVAISFSHYFGVDLDTAIQRMTCRDTVHNGHPDNGYELIGSWHLHTQSWMECTQAPILHVRYRDLVQDTAATLTRIVEFLGHAPDPERITQAVEFSRFGKLKQQESADGFVENGSQGSAFFRVGLPGKWTDEMTVDQARRIINANAELMERLGFMRLFLA